MRPLTVTRTGAIQELDRAMAEPRRRVEHLAIRAVRAVALGERIPAVAKILGLGTTAVRSWVHGYNAEGVGYFADQRGGQPCRLKDEQLIALRARIAAGPQDADGVCSLRGADLQRILRDEYGARYSLDGVYYLLHHQLGQSYLQPRPRHRKADLEAQAFFKKKDSTSTWNSSRSTSTTRVRSSKSGSPTRAASASKVL